MSSNNSPFTSTERLLIPVLNEIDRFQSLLHNPRLSSAKTKDLNERSLLLAEIEFDQIVLNHVWQASSWERNIVQMDLDRRRDEVARRYGNSTMMTLKSKTVESEEEQHENARQHEQHQYHEQEQEVQKVRQELGNYYWSRRLDNGRRPAFDAAMVPFETDGNSPRAARKAAEKTNDVNGSSGADNVEMKKKKQQEGSESPLRRNGGRMSYADIVRRTSDDREGTEKESTVTNQVPTSNGVEPVDPVVDAANKDSSKTKKKRAWNSKYRRKKQNKTPPGGAGIQ